ncbi:peptidoglycan D,D-transpeptidase FtsI family protein [Streptomyces marincola]|uniref:peptidoglycan D,D-transpeptidase FtsI family protein n=1 Tax=Streptomyces marincola TaxID=2878388 RepID=UPI001CF29806|nr:penicillin-binding transpeptidase domain-containing protein [Streptomyces marincola]UCM89130.1 penicillin-binding protein 2 [Streptomyces marincola]
MNKPMRRVSVFCGLLILALLVRVNWVQFVQADELQNHADNRRVTIERYSHPRGDIIVDGEPITGSRETDNPDFRYERTFTDGEMWAPVTGYSSQGFGASMLEGVHDSILTGDDDRLFFNNTVDMFTGEDQRGGNVITTLNADAQRAAFEGLGDAKGAVAAVNPETGEVLALASTPSYDPGTISGTGNEAGEAWLAYENAEDDPRVNRALRETYPPGSTFKVLTAAAALEHGLVEDVDTETETPSPYYLPETDQVELPNDADPGNFCEDATVRTAIRYSCNSVFAKLSDEVGNEQMIEMAEEFGFNEEHFVPIRTAMSSYPEDNRPQNAQAGIGQASNRATPLQMAMVASAIANDGTLMRPYMVDQLVAPNLNVIEQHDPEEMSQPVSPENAQMLQSAMETMVEESVIDVSGLGDVRVGGKTGTAQHGENNEETPYAWFISYAMTDEGSPVAVAVVVEDANVAREDVSGSGLAAPIAVDVMEAVLNGENAG